MLAPSMLTRDPALTRDTSGAQQGGVVHSGVVREVHSGEASTGGACKGELLQAEPVSVREGYRRSL